MRDHDFRRFEAPCAGFSRVLSATPGPMSHSKSVRRFLLVAAVVATACGGGGTPESSSVQAGGEARRIGMPAPGTETREGALENATRVLGTAGAECPLTGAWQLCSVEDRLVRSGLAPQRADSAPSLSPGSIASARYYVGDAEAQVFIFADSAGRVAAERAGASALGEAPLLEAAVGATPSLVSSQNMAVVVYGHRERQVERVSLALSGGLPQG